MTRLSCSAYNTKGLDSRRWSDPEAVFIVLPNQAIPFVCNRDCIIKCTLDRMYYVIIDYIIHNRCTYNFMSISTYITKALIFSEVGLVN